MIKTTNNYSFCNYLVDGGWSNWSVFGECSVTCGTGTQNRVRECNNPPPSDQGTPCPGNSEESKSCEKPTCSGKYDYNTSNFKTLYKSNQRAYCHLYYFSYDSQR